MGIGEKIARAINKIKGKLIVSFILWLILVIVFVAPLSGAISDGLKVGTLAMSDGNSWEVFFEALGVYLKNPINAIGHALAGDTNGMFWSVLWKFTLVYLLAVTIGITKAIPKHEYDGIENGSSDWCENGEEYKTLSNKKGIILAEKEYLPVDKRGNVNVLVVGRIWCW